MREIVSAEEQYQKYPKLKKESVQELAEWISQHPQYPTPTEQMVIRFLYSCYYDMDNAKKCVNYYYTIRIENPIFFLDWDIEKEDLKNQLDVVEYGMIPVKDPRGYTVILHRLQVFEPTRYNFFHSCRLFGMLIESILKVEGNMKGLVVVFDMKGVSLMHVFRLKISTLKLFFLYVQEACPIRLKAIHVVNTLPIASKIMMVIKPFLKKEILELLKFHSENYDEIQKELPLECLPSDYGGTQPSIAELHESYKKWMLELRELFLEDDIDSKEFFEEVKKAEAEAKQNKSSWSFL